MATNKFGEHQVFNSYLKIINVNKRKAVYFSTGET